MKKSALVIIAFIATAILFTACKKPKTDDKDDDPKNDPPQKEYGILAIKVENYVGAEPLILNHTEYYTNAAGNDFKVKKYKYYLTNFKLVNTDNTEFVQPESYYLSDQASGDLEFNIIDIPKGEYKSVKFLIGVDSAKNVSGAQTGALDPIWEMFWDWNTGYIMAMLEGESPVAVGNIVSFHIGGYAGPYSALREVTINFSENINIGKDKTPSFTLRSDLLKWFSGTNLIDFTTFSLQSAVDSYSVKIADNYKNMFEIRDLKIE